MGVGSNWSIPSFLPVLLRYVSGPVLAIIFSFAYPDFYELRYDPLMIFGFIVAHLCLLLVLVGFVMPRYYDAMVPLGRLKDGTDETIVNVTKDLAFGEPVPKTDLPRDGGEMGPVDAEKIVTKE